MKKNNIFVILFISLIRKAWHGKIGRTYVRDHKIICRFYPKCSNYGITSLEKYGFLKGWYLTYKRVKICDNDNTASCVDYP